MWLSLIAADPGMSVRAARNIAAAYKKSVTPIKTACAFGRVPEARRLRQSRHHLMKSQIGPSQNVTPRIDFQYFLNNIGRADQIMVLLEAGTQRRRLARPIGSRLKRSARPSVRKYSSRDTVSLWLPVVTSIDVVGIDLSGIHPVKSLGSLV
jgi:hypothetical protein